MKVAEVTADQAAKLDPATLQPGQAIAVRFGSVRAIIGPLPTADAPAPLLVGQLRTDNDHAVLARNQGFSVVDVIRTAPATSEGLRTLLRWLDRIASVQKLQPVPTTTGAA